MVPPRKQEHDGSKQEDELKDAVYPSPIRRGEEFWFEMRPVLLKKGYQLRKRYQPGWTPPWRKVRPGEPFLDMLAFEDGMGAVSSLCFNV